MESPAYFLVAHVLTKHNGAKFQFKNFKKLVPTATDTDIIKSPINPRYVTFVATFDVAVDFDSIKKKLPATYGGTKSSTMSKVLDVQYSTTDKPSYFYSAYLIQNFTLHQRHNGFAQQKQELVKAAIALVATKPKVICTLYASSVLVEIVDHDIRPEDIANINRTLTNMPHLALLASRELKKE